MEPTPRPRIRGCCGCAFLLFGGSLLLAVALTWMGAKPPIAADTLVDAAGSAASSGLRSGAYALDPSRAPTPGVFVAPPTPTTRVTVVYIGTPPPR